MEPIDDDERARRQSAIDRSRASVRLEGTILPPTVEELNGRFVRGEIDCDEFVRLVLEAADHLGRPR